MERLPIESLESAIGVQEMAIEAVFDKAILEFLKELKEYRTIGTVEECEEARERQQTMEVKEVLLPNGRTGYECSNCGNEIEVNMFHGEYCHWCGQKLDWSE